MPASSGIFSLLDLIMRDPNAPGGSRGIPQPSPMSRAGGPGAPSQQPGEQQDTRGERVGGGFVEGMYGAGDSPMQDPKNWFLSRGDLESPLGYMGASHVGSGFGNANWQPNDQGGYFTIDQLYQGRNVPDVFHRGSSAPSTNNWQLTIPYGGGPGAILRNGQVIYPGSPETGHGAPLGADTGPGGPAEGASPIGSWSNPGTGAWYGVPNTWRGMSGWPGASLQNWNYDRWPVGNV